MIDYSPRQAARVLGPAALILTVAGTALVAVRSPAFLPGDFYDPKEITLHLGATLSFGAFALRIFLAPLDDVDVGAVAFVLVSFAAFVTATNEWQAVRVLGYTTSAAMLFWAARKVQPFEATVVLCSIVVLTSVLTLLAICEGYGIVPRLSQFGRGPSAMLGNRNHLAHLAVIALPACWLLLQAKHLRFHFFLLCAAVAVMSAGIVFLRTRGAWIAGGAIIAFLTLSSLQAGSAGRRRAMIFAAALAVGVLAVVIVPSPTAWHEQRPYWTTLTRLGDVQTGSGAGRLVQYRSTLALVKSEPILGHGLGGWQLNYPTVATPDDPSFRSTFPEPVPRAPSSDWLAITSERGIPGLICLALLGYLLARNAGPSPHVQVEQRRALRATLAALLLIGVVDSITTVPVNVAASSVLLGALSPSGVERRARLWSSVLAGVLIVAAAASLVAALFAARRLLATHAIRTTPGFNGIVKAASINPHDVTLNIYLGNNWARSGDCYRADSAYDRATALFPHSPAARRRLPCTPRQ